MATTRRIIGWREWLALPDLGVHAIKAKIDTGAKTSALHVQDATLFQEADKDMVSFHVDTDAGDTVAAIAPVVEWRVVKDSGGHSTNRPIIHTLCRIGNKERVIDISLTQRTDMGFPMLLGRQALRGGFLVDANLSFVAPKAAPYWDQPEPADSEPPPGAEN
jgi:hypothetical protein